MSPGQPAEMLRSQTFSGSHQPSNPRCSRLCVDVWLESRTFVERLDSFLDMAMGPRDAKLTAGTIQAGAGDVLLQPIHFLACCPASVAQCSRGFRLRSKMFQADGCTRHLHALRAAPWLRDEPSAEQPKRRKAPRRGRGRSAEAISKEPKPSLLREPR